MSEQNKELKDYIIRRISGKRKIDLTNWTKIFSKLFAVIVTLLMTLYFSLQRHYWQT
jgi:hypothetical protein